MENKLEYSQSVEDFDSFLHKFYSDSVFQISRVVFPLESDTEIEEEYLDALKDTINISIDKEPYVPYNKGNWIMLNDSLFENDSVITIEGIKYIRRFYKQVN